MNLSAAPHKPRLQRSNSCCSASTATTGTITLLLCNRQSLCDGNHDESRVTEAMMPRETLLSPLFFTVKLGFDQHELKHVYDSDDDAEYVADKQCGSDSDRIHDEETDTDTDSRPMTPEPARRRVTIHDHATSKEPLRPRRGRLLPRRRNSADAGPSPGTWSLLTRHQHSRSDAQDTRSLVGTMPPSKLSVAQKHGCFQYIKRRHSIAMAFAVMAKEPPSNNADDRQESNDLGISETHWEFVKVKHGVEVFKSRRSRCEIRGVTRVNSSVKNVMSLLAAGESTESFLHSQQILLGKDQVLDARVLASCVPSSASRYFHCGLKYIAMKNPFGLNPLDVVFLDYTDVTTTPDDKLVGYRIIESIRVPEFRCATKYTRASIRCEVYLVRETDVPGVVEVTFASHLDPKSKYSASKRNTWLDQTVVRLRNLRSYAEQAGFSHRLMLETTKLVRDVETCRRCSICETSFSFLRKRHNCRLCGEVACRRCCRKLPVFVGAETTRVRVCLGCMLQSRRQPDELGRVELERSRRYSIGNSTWIAYDEIEDCDEEEEEEKEDEDAQ